MLAPISTRDSHSSNSPTRNNIHNARPIVLPIVWTHQQHTTAVNNQPTPQPPKNYRPKNLNPAQFLTQQRLIFLRYRNKPPGFSEAGTSKRIPARIWDIQVKGRDCANERKGGWL